MITSEYIRNDTISLLKKTNSPLSRFTKLGFVLPLALVKAVCMSEMAVVSCEGVGDAYDEAYSFPMTCVDVEKVPDGSSVRENPVKPVEEMGLTPMFPAAYWHHRQKSGIFKILYRTY
jgi:hypothetical protein